MPYYMELLPFYCDEMLEIITNNEGITLNEIAKKLGLTIANDLLPTKVELKYNGKIREEVTIEKNSNYKDVKVYRYYLRDEYKAKIKENEENDKSTGNQYR